MGPMRQAGRAGSAVLEKLAGTGSGRVPDQSSLLSEWEANERRNHALGIAKPESLWLWLGAFLAPFGMLGALAEAAYDWFVLALVASLGFGFGWKAHMKLLRAQAKATLDAKLAGASQQAFPIHGYASWLVCDRPLFDVELTSPFDRGLLEAAVRAIDPAIGLEILDERRARFALPPRGTTMKYGNVALFDRVFDELLIPLHQENPIVRIDMGGIVEHR